MPCKQLKRDHDKINTSTKAGLEIASIPSQKRPQKLVLVAKSSRRVCVCKWEPDYTDTLVKIWINLFLFCD